MSIKILSKYIKLCEENGKYPTWEGLKLFKEVLRISSVN